MQRRHCFWRDMLLLNFLDVIRHAVSTTKKIQFTSIVLGLAAEISKTDIPKLKTTH